MKHISFIAKVIYAHLQIFGVRLSFLACKNSKILLLKEKIRFLLVNFA